MKIPYAFGHPDDKPATDKLALDRLVASLLPRFQPVAVNRRSFFVNDIPQNFYIDADENMLATVIGSLLNSVALRSQNSCIRVSAKRFNDIILLRLKDANNKGFNPFNREQWLEVKPIAEKLGGCILADEETNDTVTVIFSFRSLPNAA